MTASGWGGGKGAEGLNKKEKGHGHGQQCGDYWREGGIKRLNGNGKKYNKK